jgi:hypothetical protein
MSSNVSGADWRTRTLRAWQLALLRFAVTLDNADRLAALAIAAEIDRLGPEHGDRPDFGFFRRTSAELCAAIQQPNEHNTGILRQYLARIDDCRLRGAFTAAIETGEKTSSAGKPFKRDNGLWRGLFPRANQPV